jgi:pyroglutamyl-peptidase
MKVLLTGFGPFPGVDSNPSELVALELGARPGLRHEVLAEVLPVEYEAAGARVRELITAHEPDAVVCLGTAAKRVEINLERVALNLDDAAIPDNAGRHLVGEPIVEDGPAAYWSTLPLDRMREALASLKVPAVISNHAGAYVCNHVFYSARHQIELTRLPAPCGLIHLPLPAELLPGEERSESTLPMATLVDAVERCLGVLFELETSVHASGAL